jgi:hypothetical protein
LDQIVEQ